LTKVNKNNRFNKQMMGIKAETKSQIAKIISNSKTRVEKLRLMSKLKVGKYMT
jgi:hypothetical protein